MTRPLAASLPLEALALVGAGAGPTGRRARTRARPVAPSTAGPRPPSPTTSRSSPRLRARLLGADAGHLREHVRAGREGALLCLVVDASGSMGARRRLARVKGALIALLRDAYARRDRVAVIAFRDQAATVIVAPGAPIERAAAAIGDAPHRRPHAARRRPRRGRAAHPPRGARAPAAAARSRSCSPTGA